MNTTAQQKEISVKPVDKLKLALESPSVVAQFKNAMQENSGLFVASLIDLFLSDNNLQKCNPNLVIMEALKAATLKLPINKSLGFAYIIPYNKSVKGADGSWQKVAMPQFQLGYKGMIQLAMRTGHYKFLNADVIYEGEFQGFSRLTGELDINGQRTGDEVVGYFAYLKMLNGFEKAVFSTVEGVRAHAEKFSKSYQDAKSPWTTDFDAMAIKTMLRQLLSRYGLMSVEMVNAIETDDKLDQEYAADANSEMLPPLATQALPPGETIDADTGEVTGPEGMNQAPPAEESMPSFAMS